MNGMETTENMKLEKPKMPEEIKFREGITECQGKTFSDELKKACRIYPHLSQSEGFFIAKIKKTG